ncbi:porin family protein [Bacteroides sp. UBA939]|uniref:porin family protein n=1 Tax=Bacteroides sp. UBA939 TaxID=1946092 RepID=UPI0025BB3B02|nr:porin family protein [Bacteroides sp. UBA939]
MRIWNKVFFTAAVLFFSLNLLAQDSSFRFGVKAGLNLSTAIVNEATNTRFKTGYHIGGTVDYLLPKNFLIQSGLYLSAKGSKIDNLYGSNYMGGKPDFTHTFNQFYLELPIRGAYRLNVSNDFNIVLGVGPYLGYGIGGKTKQKLNSGTWSEGNTEIEWDTFGNGVFDEGRDYLRGETLKRFDLGIGFGVDLEYRKYVLGIGYQCSVMDIASDDYYYPDLRYKNSVNIQISVGYKF